MRRAALLLIMLAIVPLARCERPALAAQMVPLLLALGCPLEPESGAAS